MYFKQMVMVVRRWSLCVGREGGGDGVMEMVEVGEKQTLSLATGVQTLLERQEEGEGGGGIVSCG